MVPARSGTLAVDVKGDRVAITMHGDGLAIMLEPDAAEIHAVNIMAAVKTLREPKSPAAAAALAVERARKA